jgi:hypothetical protein
MEAWLLHDEQKMDRLREEERGGRKTGDLGRERWKNSALLSNSKAFYFKISRETVTAVRTLMRRGKLILGR